MKKAVDDTAKLVLEKHASKAAEKVIPLDTLLPSEPVTLSPSEQEKKTITDYLAATIASFKAVETSPDAKVLKRSITQMEQIEESNSKRSNIGCVEYIDQESKHEQMRLLQALSPPRPRKFMFSGISVTDRAQFSGYISSLNADVLESDSWSDECTHLIISKVVKTEKFLAACASCAWLG